MTPLEKAFERFWNDVKRAKSAMGILYSNTSVLSPKMEYFEVELSDTINEVDAMKEAVIALSESFEILLETTDTHTSEQQDLDEIREIAGGGFYDRDE